MATSSSAEMFSQVAYPIRILIPIVYTILLLITFIGNLFNLFALCVSTDRYQRKSLHVLIWNLIVEGTIWSSIFSLVKMVSFADLGEHFALNNGRWLNDSWCKCEMYILRVMDFLLAYTIVFLCVDRCVKKRVFCYGQRRFATGICIFISLWLIVCYALIPTLFFDQQLQSFNYASYECVHNETQVNQLTWLDLQHIQTPYRTIYLLDFIFGNVLPAFLMIFFLFLTSSLRRNYKSKTYQLDHIHDDHWKQLDLQSFDDEHPHLFTMVLLLVLVFIFCQFPYYLYQLIRIYNPSIQLHLSSSNLLFAIDIPLITLRLINRAINPWLSFFLIDSIRNASSQICSSFWCCSFLPCLRNRWSCFNDCSTCLTNQWYDVTTNQHVIREIRPTGKLMKKEKIDSNGKHIQQTFEEYVRFDHRPRSTHLSDVNPALVFAGKICYQR
ncbi:unnamed protein product [Adineta ricciae]|uniref:G-protein coupled receptors family 1 profile domain-containing protein n=1 Tax=Adineta ricciae TaxID=249248 RepID=A0A814Z6U2_ADIRI|nr:unnamed protein product [Adineta ricciae]